MVFGDLSDPELPAHLPLCEARWIVATPRDADLHRDLLTALERAGYRGRLAAAVDHPDEERLLRRLGVDLVVRPLDRAAAPLIATIHAHEREQHVSRRILG